MFNTVHNVSKYSIITQPKMPKLTTWNRLVVNKPASGFIWMVCGSLFMTSVLQDVNRHVASCHKETWSKPVNLLFVTFYALLNGKCSKPDFNQAWFHQACCILMKFTSFLRLVHNWHFWLCTSWFLFWTGSFAVMLQIQIAIDSQFMNQSNTLRPRDKIIEKVY